MSDSFRQFIISTVRPPLELMPHCIYIFGRLEENEIVVPDVQASRRHAELRVEEDHSVLEDLGSSNGTFVNGRRAKEKRLADADMIRIGSISYRYLIRKDQPDPDELMRLEAEFGSVPTVELSALLKEGAADKGVFMGSLTQFTLAEVLQFLHMNKSTGTLEVLASGNRAHFWFVDGDIIDGENNGRPGAQDALWDLAEHRMGLFNFQPSEEARKHEHRLKMRTDVLLLEVARLLDEKHR